MENNQGAQVGEGNVSVSDPKVLQTTPPVSQTPRSTPPKSETPQTPPSVGDEGEMVSIPKTVLENVLNRLEKVEGEAELLRGAADQNKLIAIQNMRNAGKLVKSAQVSTYSGKVVIGWKIVKDDVHFEGEKLVEEQIVKVFFEDKTDQEMSLRLFNSNLGKRKGEIIEESKDKDGVVRFKVQFNDGKEVVIGGAYIN